MQFWVTTDDYFWVLWWYQLWLGDIYSVCLLNDYYSIRIDYFTNTDWYRSKWTGLRQSYDINKKLCNKLTTAAILSCVMNKFEKSNLVWSKCKNKNSFKINSIGQIDFFHSVFRRSRQQKSWRNFFFSSTKNVRILPICRCLGWQVISQAREKVLRKMNFFSISFLFFIVIVVFFV